MGPGPGALTRKLIDRYPLMTAIELDQRAVAFLGEKIPQLKVIHQDVLTVDWPAMAAERGGNINIIANLPYISCHKCCLAWLTAIEVSTRPW